MYTFNKDYSKFIVTENQFAKSLLMGREKFLYFVLYLQYKCVKAK